MFRRFLTVANSIKTANVIPPTQYAVVLKDFPKHIPLHNQSASRRVTRPTEIVGSSHPQCPSNHEPSNDLPPELVNFLRLPTVPRAVELLKTQTNKHHGMMVFHAILQANLPFKEGFVQAMLMFCVRCSPLDAPLVLEAAVRMGLTINSTIFCTFISACKRTTPPTVQNAFEWYLKCGPRSHNSISSMANFLRAERKPYLALRLFDDAISHNVEFSEPLLGSLIAACAEAACLDGANTAATILLALKSGQISLPVDLPHFTNLINAFTSVNRPVDALGVVALMHERGIAVDSLLYVSLIKCCLGDAQVDEVPQLAPLARIYDYIRLHDAHAIANDFVASSLIHAFSLCCDLDKAERVFEQRQSFSQLPSVSVFNSMIGAYGLHAMSSKAIQMFERMISLAVKPDAITLSALLNGFSHVGDFENATRYSLLFASQFQINMDIFHITCLIDLYGRRGELDTAEQLVRNNPDADIVCWMSLLAACRKHNNIPCAERTLAEIERVSEKTPRSPRVLSHLAAAYVLMSNIYAAAGQSDAATRVRNVMDLKGIQKIPGTSTLQLLDGPVKFISNDPKCYQLLPLRDRHSLLIEELKRNGYVPDISCATRVCSSFEETVWSVCTHSEKVAIAYALMVTGRDEPIRITKNLRVCADCHEATKKISLLHHREIIVRDANRHHRFKDGKCSCNDYW